MELPIEREKQLIPETYDICALFWNEHIQEILKSTPSGVQIQNFIESLDIGLKKIEDTTSYQVTDRKKFFLAKIKLAL